MSRPRVRMISAIAVAAVLAAVLAACGSSSSSSSSGSSSSAASGAEPYPASFTTMVADAKKPITVWPGPTASPPIKKGALVYGIPCSKVAEGCEFINEGVAEAAKAAGWQYKTINPEGDPDKSNAAVRQAVNGKASAIIMVSVDPKLVSVPLEEAKKAGIAVILVAGGHENEQPFLKEHGVAHDVSLHSQMQGQLLGAFAAVDSKGKAQVAMFTAPEFKTITQRAEGFKESFTKCPGCKVASQTNFTQNEIATQLGPKYESVLQANPSVNYGWVGLDAAAGVMVAATEQPGARKPPLLSFDGNKQNIQFVLEGKQIVDIGTPLHWIGWAALDDANRVLQKQAPVEDDGIPSRLITKENAKQYVSTGFQGEINYQEKYKQLWSAGKTDKSVTPAG